MPFLRPKGIGEAGVVLSALLPAPASDVPLEKIMRFKESRREELLRLRTLVMEDFSSRLAELPADADASDVKHIVQRFLDEVERERAVLSRLLDDSVIKTAWSYLKGIASLKPLPVLAGGAAGAVTLIDGGASLAVAGAVVTIVQVAETYLDRKAAVANSPVAFLHAAQRKRLIT